MTTDERLCPVRLGTDGKVLHLLDQRLLPREEVWLELSDVEAVARAIEDLAVRGAPAIGCTAALGLAAASSGFPERADEFLAEVAAGCDRLASTRPTAVNLFVALEQLRAAVAEAPRDATVSELRDRLVRTARAHAANDLDACLKMAEHGAKLVPDGATILTHCNAGALATAGYGTALGVVRRAHELGKGIRVIADETRPILQGARLTAWELARDGIPVEVIADNQAGSLMRRGEIDIAIVGADRIARNGDVVNKIGTYSVAVLCRYHEIPFFVAAPWTTIDRGLATGNDVPIEERGPDEIRLHGGVPMTPEGVAVRNPAFDVTPAPLVKAIITERGVFAPNGLAEADAK